MGIKFRRSVTTALASVAVVASTAIVAGPADAATTYTVSGTVKVGSPLVAANNLQVVLCAGDCINSESAGIAGADYTDTAGAYSLAVESGTYAVVVNYLSNQTGYDFADDPAYLKVDGTKYTVTTSFAAATKVTVSANRTLNLALDPPVRNAQAKFTQSTTGSVGYLPCAGHRTTAKPTPFSPSTARLAYQWIWADTSSISSTTTVHTIGGATSASYTPGGSLVGKYLFVRMTATLPGYVGWTGRGYIGQVGNPKTCTPHLATIPKSWVKSYGKKHGTAKHGKKVSVAGAKATKGKRLKVSYQWVLAGTVVKTGKSYRIPAAAKGKLLVAKVTFSRPGYKARTKTIKFGRVK